VDVTGSDEHSSLLRYVINNGRKKFLIQAPACLFVRVGLFSKHVKAVSQIFLFLNAK